MKTISKIKFPLLLNSNVHYFDYAATAIMPKEVMMHGYPITQQSMFFLGKGKAYYRKMPVKNSMSAQKPSKDSLGQASRIK